MVNQRRKRRDQLQYILEQDPFLTDDQLAALFGVSVATIRLDRMALGIPELRERTKEMAATVHSKLRSMHGMEVIGELVQLDLGQYGISILPVSDALVFERTRILRGHHLFAQGNSLAAALVNSPRALTARAEVRFERPVYLDQRVVCEAEVEEQQYNRYTIAVNSKVDGETVFSGQFVVADVAGKEESLK